MPMGIPRGTLRGTPRGIPRGTLRGTSSRGIPRGILKDTPREMVPGPGGLNTPTTIQPLRLFTTSSTKSQEPRINQLGIQYLSEGLHKRIFPKTPAKNYLKPHNKALLELSKNHLNHHGLLGKDTQITDPINIENIPNLVGNNSLQEHFYKIGTKASEPYLSKCHEFLHQEMKLPPKPSKWVFKPGWYRYEYNKEPEPVKYPLEDEMVFDAETIYKRSPYAVMATAVTPKAWYGWVSPFLTNYAKDSNYDDWEHLIPLNTLKQEKLVLGYNVCYDRARVLEEYNIKQSKAFYLDGMSLHIACSGLSSHQRPMWHKHKNSSLRNDEINGMDDMNNINGMDDMNEDLTSSSNEELAQELLDDPWLNKGAPNSLANVADFHCGIKLDKTVRNVFDTLDPQTIINDFNNLMDYCSDDVNSTYEVCKKLFPIFKQKIPHPVSFAALKHLGNLILPTTKKWETYIKSAEEVYQSNRDSVNNILKDRVNELVDYIKLNDSSLKPKYESDPWLKQLNWEIKQPRLKKNGEPVANQAYLTGYPEWYRDLFKTLTTDSKSGEKTRDMNISVRTRITPLLLRLKWEGYPLFWTESNGWCFKVPYDEQEYISLESKGYLKAKLDEKDLESYIEELRGYESNESGINQSFELFKVPHPEGSNKRSTAVMSKSYAKFFEKGILTSEYSYAQEILDLNSTASYWMGNRARILDQFVVYGDSGSDSNSNSNSNSKPSFFPTKKESKTHPEMGIILPKLVSMGTITRRATENTWLTASNAKQNRIGSELKSTIEAPDGYTIVGADVDSEELWIAALIGDSVFKIHGSTALSWMTLEGDKSQKTDLHSKTAEILGISRNDAKVFNYGRIYGAGVKFATRLLKQCNGDLTDDQVEEMAKKLYSETKGSIGNSKLLPRRVYHGGTESIMFNALESIAHLEDPRTPVLGASITDALTSRNLNKNNYLTSRTNWAIQSSGVDYLHLLIVSMDYLIKKFKVDARLMITVHDELRYLVNEADKYKVALLLQISNLWTRAMFAERLGFTELPQSVAFFSEVDIDKILRKEVSLECVTPSQPNPIPPGESLNILEILQKTDNGKVLGASNSNDIKLPNDNGFTSPQYNDATIIEELTKHLNEDMKVIHTKLQMSVNKEEWKKNITQFGKSKRSFEYNYFEGINNEDSMSPTSSKKVKAKANTNTKAQTNKISKSTKGSSSKNTPTFKSEFNGGPVSSGSRIRARKVEEFDIVSNGDEELQQLTKPNKSVKNNPQPKHQNQTPKSENNANITTATTLSYHNQHGIAEDNFDHESQNTQHSSTPKYAKPSRLPTWTTSNSSGPHGRSNRNTFKRLVTRSKPLFSKLPDNITGRQYNQGYNQGVSVDVFSDSDINSDQRRRRRF